MKISQLVHLLTVIIILVSAVTAAVTVAVMQMNQGLQGSIFLIVSLIGTVISALIGIIGFSSISRGARRPAARLSQTVSEIAKGNLNINPDPLLLAHDVSGELAGNIYKLADLLKNMSGGFSSAYAEVNGRGNLGYRLNDSACGGFYKEMIDSMNKLIDGFVLDRQDFMNAAKEISNGNLDCGGKAAMNENIAALSSGLKEVNSEILTFLQAMESGNADIKTDADKYGGEWRKLFQSLNSFAGVIAEKINWYEAMLDAIPFPLSVTDNAMKWTFVNKATEDFIGKTRKELAGQPCHNWGASICRTENCGINCANRGSYRTTFNQSGMDFQVDVAYIKNLRGEKIGHVEALQDMTKLESAIRHMNEIMQDTMTASHQVSQEAQQISESSQEIAAGAASQASTIEELNASIDIINSQTHLTAQNSKNASELSKSAREKAAKGNGEMQRMLDSMEAIKKSTHNIAKIIGTIESIAFQTNLLALNASVEAARAGQHGKGFSVVADEVRLLAGHSKQAAQETNELITSTISKVDEGTTIALSTATSFREIVGDFEEVSKIIQEIALASSEQAESVEQFDMGITKISAITQSNSAISQEAAAASEELASQSEKLINMFKDR